MEPTTGLALGAVAAVVLGAVAAHRTRLRKRSWLAAARRLQLTNIAESPIQGYSSLAARAEPLGVLFREYQHGNAFGTWILIDGLGYDTSDLSIRPKRPGMEPSGAEIETGDPDFDAAVRVEGSPALAFAVLAAPVRARLVPLLFGKLEGQPVPLLTASLQDGYFQIQVPHALLGDHAGQVRRALDSALAAARELVAPADLPARLAENLRSERFGGVRAQIVKVLAREYPRHPAALQALRGALEDRIGEVRLHAAIALGDPGQETLLDLAAHPEDSYASRAITALAHRLPVEQGKRLLERALAEGRPLTACACLGLLARGPSSEELLVRALGSENETVAVAAARALERVGTAAAIAPLRVHAAGLLPSPLRNAARQAVAGIQTRLTGAAAGQLSLAAETAGTLSFAGGEAGELSLADREEGHDVPKEH